MKVEGQKSPAPDSVGREPGEWQRLESNMATLCRTQTDMPGIPVGDHYPEIHRATELPQVPMPIS